MSEEVTAREHHEVVIDHSKLVEGENTFICTICKQSLVLVWNGEHFSLPEKEANDPNFGTVGITFTEQADNG